MPRKKKKEIDPATLAFEQGVSSLKAELLFVPLLYRSSIIRSGKNRYPDKGWAVVTSNGEIYVHPTRRAAPEEWVYVLAHCLLHLGFGHFKEREHPKEWNIACDCFVAGFMSKLKIGRVPEDLDAPMNFSASSEDTLYRQFCEYGIPEELEYFSTAGKGICDMQFQKPQKYYFGSPPDWEKSFAAGVSNAVSRAMKKAAGIEVEDNEEEKEQIPAQRAKQWFISSFPLLGALAAEFRVIEDPLLCGRMKIRVAAVNAELKEIYFNPVAGLDEGEYRFVMAHELLHVGLRHDARSAGRDPYLWNVACDYVINGWLMEMDIGHVPQIGILHDPRLRGLSAEAIYDRIVTDMRRYRKLSTLRGVGLGDMLEGRSPNWWEAGEGVALDEFYQRALSQGLEYHYELGRGFLPEGLIEEIRALSQPVIPWDVKLARWFDNHFSPIEKRRSYARPSRRQSASPDIPRPYWVIPDEALENRTFGVILDTSGSMDRNLLAKALGTIASYSISRDVPLVRVVFCDATYYDQGYMPPEDIAGRVKVKGRGGTILQPAIDLLEREKDFPKDGPLLIITDGYCDRLKIHREHAFVIPKGNHLPFVAKGEVFYIG
jgi:predicted metal-dependent peptidase